MLEAGFLGAGEEERIGLGVFVGPLLDFRPGGVGLGTALDDRDDEDESKQDVNRSADEGGERDGFGEALGGDDPQKCCDGTEADAADQGFGRGGTTEIRQRGLEGRPRGDNEAIQWEIGGNAWDDKVDGLGGDDADHEDATGEDRLIPGEASVGQGHNQGEKQGQETRVEAEEVPSRPAKKTALAHSRRAAPERHAALGLGSNRVHLRRWFVESRSAV